jgi:hypothetical protein
MLQKYAKSMVMYNKLKLHNDEIFHAAKAGLPVTTTEDSSNFVKNEYGDSKGMLFSKDVTNMTPEEIQAEKDRFKEERDALATTARQQLYQKVNQVSSDSDITNYIIGSLSDIQIIVLNKYWKKVFDSIYKPGEVMDKLIFLIEIKTYLQKHYGGILTEMTNEFGFEALDNIGTRKKLDEALGLIESNEENAARE